MPTRKNTPTNGKASSKAAALEEIRNGISKNGTAKQEQPKEIENQPEAEKIEMPDFKYFEGSPRQYRADCKAGKFNINGTQDKGNTLEIQPIAWRFFTDDILGMGRKKWVEIFFIDTDLAVSAILFHGYSRENLERLASQLFYDDVTLADIRLKITFDKKQNKEAKATYYIAEFSYTKGGETSTQLLKEYAQSVRIYREETLNEDCEIQAQHAFYNPHYAEIELLEEAQNEADENQALEDDVNQDKDHE